MSIKIKAREQAQPGVVGGGVKKFYPTPVHDREMSFDSLAKSIEDKSSMSGAYIRAVLYGLEEEVINGLLEGRIIRFGDLGSFRIAISGDGKNTAKEVNAASVKKTGVIFTPGSKLRQKLKTAKFTVVR